MNKHLTHLLLAATVMTSASIASAAELVVVVNTANPATAMTSAQASQFFLGKSAMFTPVDLPENSPIRAEFYKKVADKDLSEVKTIWSKLVFTGKGTAPKEMHNYAEVKKAVAANPTGIGYIERSAVDATVKVVTVLP
ncbi:hypothetical protein DFR42_102486 [Undibacterium pigrum]|uniref:Periplasmic binding family protein n=2 Tax=Undibacterium pigrum TaxID=401470 RepID=A0A318JAX1_9BURK|nr:hypothetical protein [Undibacterium pigrum]PXX45258.1 hypothetical protein DFR42_102486 [Undibacterium pigrum]